MDRVLVDLTTLLDESAQGNLVYEHLS